MSLSMQKNNDDSIDHIIKDFSFGKLELCVITICFKYQYVYSVFDQPVNTRCRSHLISSFSYIIKDQIHDGRTFYKPMKDPPDIVTRFRDKFHSLTNSTCDFLVWTTKTLVSSEYFKTIPATQICQNSLTFIFAESIHILFSINIGRKCWLQKSVKCILVMLYYFIHVLYATT